MCIIIIMVVSINRIIFLINSSSSHCRLTVTSSVFFLKLNKKVDELIMLECARSPHVAIFVNELKSKQLCCAPFIVFNVKCSYIMYYYIIVKCSYIM